jgi:hypothetical protein
VFHKFIRASDVNQLTETELRNDGTEFASCSGDTVRGRTVTRGESLSGDNECGSVRTEVLEKVGETIEEDENIGARGRCDQLVICEA